MTEETLSRKGILVAFTTMKGCASLLSLTTQRKTRPTGAGLHPCDWQGSESSAAPGCGPSPGKLGGAELCLTVPLLGIWHTCDMTSAHGCDCCAVCKSERLETTNLAPWGLAQGTSALPHRAAICRDQGMERSLKHTVYIVL